MNFNSVFFQSSTVGYLTMNKSALPSVPPPIDDNQDNSEGLLGWVWASEVLSGLCLDCFVTSCVFETMPKSWYYSCDTPSGNLICTAFIANRSRYLIFKLIINLQSNEIVLRVANFMLHTPVETSKLAVSLNVISFLLARGSNIFATSSAVIYHFVSNINKHQSPETWCNCCKWRVVLLK